MTILKKITHLLWAMSLLSIVGCNNILYGIAWQDSPADGLQYGDRPDTSHYFITSDEAYATLIGHRIMQGGGNAVDAIAAMAIAMTATLPNRTSLAAGGMCSAVLPDDNGDLAPMVIKFNAVTPSQTMASSLYQLQRQQGNLAWAQIIAPTEKMLRVGFSPNRATVASNPFWKIDGNVIFSPLLADSLGRLRQKPLHFIYGTKVGSMNYHFTASGRAADKKMTANSKPKPLVILKGADIIPRPIAGDLAITTLKSTGIANGEKPWADYIIGQLNKSQTNKNQTGKKPKLAGYNNGVDTMAVDALGRAIACHFTIDNGEALLVINDMGFYAPRHEIYGRAGNFIILNDDSPIGIMSIGQSSHGVICAEDLNARPIANEQCQWVIEDAPSGLSIMGAL